MTKGKTTLIQKDSKKKNRLKQLSVDRKFTCEVENPYRAD